jgi:hypothetical protein
MDHGKGGMLVGVIVGVDKDIHSIPALTIAGPSCVSLAGVPGNVRTPNNTTRIAIARCTDLYAESILRPLDPSGG